MFIAFTTVSTVVNFEPSPLFVVTLPLLLLIVPVLAVNLPSFPTFIVVPSTFTFISYALFGAVPLSCTVIVLSEDVTVVLPASTYFLLVASVSFVGSAMLVTFFPPKSKSPPVTFILSPENVIVGPFSVFFILVIPFKLSCNEYVNVVLF
ncbi:hypothetical protein STFE110948_03680 [Streptobacillus felis]